MRLWGDIEDFGSISVVFREVFEFELFEIWMFFMGVVEWF